ncbi:MAG TPA: hypothetical protein VI756_30005 [Blastocatellia bacterium]
MRYKQGILASPLCLPVLGAVIAAIAFSALLPGATIHAGGTIRQDKVSKVSKGDDRPAKLHVVSGNEGHPVLWNQSASIETLDLFYGSGSRQDAPDPSGKFYYAGRDNKGTQKETYVKDDKGREWIVKFGQQARPEAVATRIVWAMGYHVDQDYLLPQVHIDGMPHPDALNVGFKPRPSGYEEVGLWDWQHNPFVGTRELDGLKVLMAFLDNWDLKSSNNKVVRPDNKSGENPDDRIYYVANLGATFGTTGSFEHDLHLPFHPAAGTKDEPFDYADEPFIDGVIGGAVQFHYKGRDPAVMKGISVANAQWMGGMLARLSQKQLIDAFRAGGYGDMEISVLLRAIKDRIGELQQAGQGNP